MTSPQERIAIAIGNFAHAMETNNADGAGSTELRQETREALHTLFTELAAERDAATTARDGMERIAEQSRRDGQEIAAGLHERIAELERELAAAKGKLAALLDASKAGSEFGENEQRTPARWLRSEIEAWVERARAGGTQRRRLPARSGRRSPRSRTPRLRRQPAAREREELNKAKNELIDDRDAARRALAALVQAIKSATLEGLCGLHRTEVFVAAEKAARGVS